MKNTKQKLIEGIDNRIIRKEKEIKESDEELETLNTDLKVENKALNMDDIKEYLKEDFKYSALALEDMILMEENKNSELKKELEVLKYRKEVIKSQFTDSELDN